MATLTITPRLIAREDLAVTNAPGETFVSNVLGTGPTTLTKVPLLWADQLVAAANDAAAAGAGVGLYEAYINTGTGRLTMRHV